MGQTILGLSHRKLVAFQPVPAANGLSIINIPTGPTYYAIDLNYKRTGVDATESEFKADVKWVRLKIGNKTCFEVSGKRLVDIFNKYYGIAFANGIAYIPLARPWLKTVEAVENSAWGTANVDTFTLEVEFAASAVSPTMEAHALASVYSRDLG